ncbi:RNA polymerase subunit sigma-70 [Amycolatopsis japonica]|uniref:RNA polymerase subunit sigma-70 n=1 Tax=Amycolatopsis japonica TaxID=208439 RepID=UPI0036701B77
MDRARRDPALAEEVGDFASLTDPFRRELLLHCRRILGSVDEAEDLVQETYLRAWRAYEDFEGRSSLRSWLYRIATNACLNAIETRGRRPMPTGLGGPAPGADEAADPAGREPTWLEPIADVLFGTAAEDPAKVVMSRANMRLALAAAWQHLPPRQRAVLILREVLNWQASEVAELLGTTSTAVHSMLQRARSQLSQVTMAADDVAEPADRRQRQLLDQYVAAFEVGDLTLLMQLLTEDAVCELPPDPAVLAGREEIARFLGTECPAFGTCKLVRCSVDGRPAFATYMLGEDGAHHAYSVEVLTITDSGIARIVSHQKPSLFAGLGLPTRFTA